MFTLEFSPGLKITDETLEDRLAYDEIFVEYFNAFMALPVSWLKYMTRANILKWQ